VWLGLAACGGKTAAISNDSSEASEVPIVTMVLLSVYKEEKSRSANVFSSFQLVRTCSLPIHCLPPPKFLTSSLAWASGWA
jgi:hypothetical protein